MNLEYNKQNPIFLSKLLAVIIPLTSVFLQYTGAIGNVGIWLMIGCVIVNLVIYKKINFNMCIVSFFIILEIQQLLVTVIYRYSIEIYIKNMINIFLIILTVSISALCVNTNKMIKIYSYLGAITTLAIYTQTILHYLLHSPIAPIVILPRLFIVAENWTALGRASGFFSEPQVYCTYMLPLLMILLYQKKYKLAIFITTGFLLSTSSLGIGMAFLLWLYTLLSSKSPTVMKIMIVGLLLISVLSFFSLNIFEFPRNKILSFFTDFTQYSKGTMVNNYSYTNYLRFVKAPVTFVGLPLGAKFTGVGINKLIEYMQITGINFSWSFNWATTDAMAAYFTTGFGVFIELGLVVGVFYYSMLIKGIASGNHLQKMIILLLIVQGFTTQLFFNGLCVFYLIMYQALSNYKNVLEK